jgi:xanthine dehydrogenase accessory factor
VKSDLLARLNAARAARRAAIRLTDLSTGVDALLLADDDLAAHPLAEALMTAFRSGRSGLVEAEGGRVFLTVHVPPPRLVVIGAVHITQALVPMARIAGFDVAVIDPRTAFATPERFAGVTLHALWPEEVIPATIAFDAHTALVAVTHDPKIDDMPLIAALEAGAFYVGALGSRKTHAKRVERLTAAGLPAETIARIHAPIGLDIGAASPAEIAVSVLAEVIQTLRGPKRKPA